MSSKSIEHLRVPGASTPEERVLAAGVGDNKKPFSIALLAPRCDEPPSPSVAYGIRRGSGPLSTPTGTPHHRDSTRVSVTEEFSPPSPQGTSRTARHGSAKRFATSMLAFLACTDSEQEDEKVSGTLAANAVPSYSRRGNAYTRSNLANYATPDLRSSGASPGRGFVSQALNSPSTFAAYEGINDAVHTDRSSTPSTGAMPKYLERARRYLVILATMQLAIFGWFFIPGAMTAAGGFVGVALLIVGFALSFVAGVSLERRCYNTRGNLVTTSYLDLAEATGGETLRIVAAILVAAVWLGSACILFMTCSLMLYAASMELQIKIDPNGWYSPSESSSFVHSPRGDIRWYYAIVLGVVYLCCVPVKHLLCTAAVNVWKSYLFTIVALFIAFAAFLTNLTLVVVRSNHHAAEYCVTDAEVKDFFLDSLPRGMALMLWAWAPVIVVPRMGTSHPFFQRGTESLREKLLRVVSPEDISPHGKKFFKAWLVIVCIVAGTLIVLCIVLLAILGTTTSVKIPIVLQYPTLQRSSSPRWEQQLYVASIISLCIIFVVLIVRFVSTLASMFFPSGTLKVRVPLDALRCQCADKSAADSESTHRGYGLVVPLDRQSDGHKSPRKGEIHAPIAAAGGAARHVMCGSFIAFFRDAFAYAVLLCLLGIFGHFGVCAGDRQCGAWSEESKRLSMSAAARALAHLATLTAGAFLAPLIFLLPVVIETVLNPSRDEGPATRAGSMADATTMEEAGAISTRESSPSKYFMDSLRYQGSPEEEWPLSSAVPRRDRTTSQASYALPVGPPSLCKTVCIKSVKCIAVLWTLLPLLGAIRSVIDLCESK